MLHWLSQLWDMIYSLSFAEAITTFLFGYLFSQVIYRNRHRIKLFDLFLVYPRFIQKQTSYILSLGWKFSTMFLFILAINSLTAYLIFISGFLAPIPFIIIFFTGLHVGLVILLNNADLNHWLIVLNPVSLLETTALGLAYTLAKPLAMNEFSFSAFRQTLLIFQSIYHDFFTYPFTLLALAALLEAYFISTMHLLEKKLQDPSRNR